MYKDIFVVVEQVDGKIQKVGIELLGIARELAQKVDEDVVAVILGDNIKDKAHVLIEHGADKVYVIENPVLKDYTTEPYTKAIHQIVTEKKPSIVLYGATSIGRDLAPRVSARVHTGLTADCTKLEIDEKDKLLLMTRPAFGGNILATIICQNHRPQMATVRPGVMVALPSDKQRSGVIEDYHVDLSEADMNVKILEIVKEEKKLIDITEANILVSGGRGVGKKENFAKLEALADEIEGTVSSSRASVDAGWIGKERQVGQTGKTVRPDVYFACGISGAIQHLAGMENSEYIIAINTNPEAPVFEVSDLGIVGDLHQIIPELTNQIQKIKAAKEDKSL